MPLLVLLCLVLVLLVFSGFWYSNLLFILALVVLLYILFTIGSGRWRY